MGVVGVFFIKALDEKKTSKLQPSHANSILDQPPEAEKINGHQPSPKI